MFKKYQNKLTLKKKGVEETCVRRDDPHWQSFPASQPPCRSLILLFNKLKKTLV